MWQIGAASAGSMQAKRMHAGEHAMQRRRVAGAPPCVCHHSGDARLSLALEERPLAVDAASSSAYAGLLKAVRAVPAAEAAGIREAASAVRACGRAAGEGAVSGRTPGWAQAPSLHVCPYAHPRS